ncbi:hypothetical protein MKW92_050295 [Papaver armeniacum]|nr:hypothetical protein MKW92_050295 [Papaver armeniacum]
MYATNEPGEKRFQWQYLLEMSQHVDIPWVLIGDLNFTLTDSETTSKHVDPHHLFVRDCIHQMGLIDLGASGNPFTWSNHRQGDAHTQVRLDRALSDARWLNLFSSAKVINLVAHASDHSPVLLVTNVAELMIHPSYKFYKCWLAHPTCKDVIHSAWQQECVGSPPYQLVQKLKNTKRHLLHWKKHEFGNIKTNIQRVQHQIRSVKIETHP